MPSHQARTDRMTMAGLNMIQQALSIYDQDLRLVQCNRRFRSMFDLPAELTRPGAGFEDTIRFLCESGEYGPIDNLEEAIKVRVEKALAFEPHYLERPRANGRIISVEGAPLPEGGWVTVYTDITETKRQERLLRARSAELSAELLTRAEELAATNRQLQATNSALEEAKRELTEMEARTRLTTEMLPAHVGHVNPDRIYTYSNRRLSRIMPGRPAHIVGLHIADVLGRQAYEAVRPYLDAALAGQPATFEFTDETSSRRIRTALTPNGADGAYLMSMDVTEESQTRAALAQTKRRELAAQMTSGMAHDFSNLLTIILGLQSQLSRMDLSRDAQGLVAATLGAAKRGGRLLDRIADMTGGRDHSPGPVVWSDFLRDFSTLAWSTLPDHISLVLADELGARRLWLDSGLLQDSLLNLVLNARDALGGERGEIRVTCRCLKDTWLEITVADTGPGFTEAALDQALTPFFTTKGAEGSGLGLSMVYDMTQRAGGRMRLANAGGAQVTLHLPWREAPQPVTPGLALLVEDSPDLRRSVRDMLVSLGYSVIEASAAEEARAIARDLPDLVMILSDLTLEGGSTGLDLLDALPEAPPPLFFMTSLRPDHPLYRRAAAHAPVLRKPFDQEALAGFLSLGGEP
ncbi:PAS-domain containing protein [Pseudooceanicola sp. 200-1SW]|uniref:PAS-domain containing protein n=1 Tax=Pseudooceanicola sp. 200-1SW TaxID=3425949 RepID=UPI003D7F80AD